MKIDNTDLRAYLQRPIDPTAGPANPDFIKPFVLRYGREFDRMAPPRVYPDFTTRPQACWSNCLQLATYKRLNYVEGFAMRFVGIPFHHAWCIDAEGRICDPTWDRWADDPVRGYYGVPFDRAYSWARLQAHFRQGYHDPLLDGGDDDYALLLGTETRPWLMRDALPIPTARP